MPVDEPSSGERMAEARELLQRASLQLLDDSVTDEPIPCDIPGHSTGAPHCNSAQSASHYIEFVHGDPKGRGDCSPMILAVCLDKAVYIRSRHNTPAGCKRCKTLGTLGDFVRVIGSIHEIKSAQPPKT